MTFLYRLPLAPDDVCHPLQRLIAYPNNKNPQRIASTVLVFEISGLLTSDFGDAPTKLLLRTFFPDAFDGPILYVLDSSLKMALLSKSQK